MALLSDREAFDKVALVRALFRIDADPYIKSIKNKSKKKYAEDYALSLETGTHASELNERGISYMAAQAVRISLNEFWDEASRNK